MPSARPGSRWSRPMAYLDLRLAAGPAAAAPELAPRALDRHERDAILDALSKGRAALALGWISRAVGWLRPGSDAEPVSAAKRIAAIRRYALRYRREGDGL